MKADRAMSTPRMKFKFLWRHVLQALFTLLFGGTLTAGAGCAGPADPEDSAALRHRFPEQAAKVLGGSGAFIVRDQGFALDGSEYVAPSGPTALRDAVTVPAVSLGMGGAVLSDEQAVALEATASVNPSIAANACTLFIIDLLAQRERSPIEQSPRDGR